MLACEAMDEHRNVVVKPSSRQKSSSLDHDLVSDFGWGGILELLLEGVRCCGQVSAEFAGSSEA